MKMVLSLYLRYLVEGSIQMYIYSGDATPADEIIARANSRFGVDVHGDDVRTYRSLR